MNKTYGGLKRALIKASEIIDKNSKLSWGELCSIFHNTTCINHYYTEVVNILISGRQSERNERKMENDSKRIHE